MRHIVEIQDQTYVARFESAISLAMIADFAPNAPNPFGLASPLRQVVRTEHFTGDTRQGGSCNVTQITTIPHCHGTHTESLGHVVDESVPVPNCVPSEPQRALLVDVPCIPAKSTDDLLPTTSAPSDCVITAAALGEAISEYAWSPQFASALVLRCRVAKKRPSEQAASPEMPPYLTLTAMQFVRQMEVQHLLLELPSVDRLEDGGLLLNHRTFWDLPASGHRLPSTARPMCTITELIQIPAFVRPGWYLLAIQIPAWMLDAAPSRPMLIPLEPIGGLS